MMIERDMDVKELVSSSLFYVPVWYDLSLFSSSDQTVILPYNEDIEELELEDPIKLFDNNQNRQDEQKQGFNSIEYEKK